MSILQGQAKVYLVLGSDTAIWDGMGVDRFNDTYVDALFTDPTYNAYKVMDPSFRTPLVDSYGQTIKFTWWMMGGNIFRYATNRNFPVPNIMTLYLMRKYHGEAIKKFGDEVTMHYHTFVWTDYDRDGIFWWNQAHRFTESSDDFDVTLAQYLLEENTFPVSFRSGWHAMDNDWQRYLDTLLPFSMHDDWPAVRIDTTEPIDNVYDWSKSSKEWIPFHPSADNYQLPGSLKGWNLRSTHIGGVDSAAMVAIFAKANAGVDQVACLWGHLPETDFLDNMKKIDKVAHIAALKYPGVKFRYCTAVEAMQRWRGTTDVTPPVVNISERRAGDNVTFLITTNEPIFQAQPFVAAKDLYERYYHVAARQTGTNEWTTTDALALSALAKVGVAVTDTSGNLQTAFIRYLPDDMYIDNRDESYSETSGTWTTVTNRSWGIDARTATLGQTDSAKVQWKLGVSQSGLYNIFVQVPSISNAAGKLLFHVVIKGQLAQSVTFDKPIASGDWVFVATAQLDVGGTPTIEMVAKAEGQSGKIVAADVLKLSALVRQRQIAVSNTIVDFGDVSETDTARFNLTVQNFGTLDLTIQSVSCKLRSVFPLSAFPVIVPRMQSVTLPLAFSSAVRGNFVDTLFIASDDPLQRNLALQVTAKVVSYFTTIDNEDPTRYTEFGTWSYSNAQAYGATSRYAPLGPGSYARYTTTLAKSGVYDIQVIVPKTVNASTRARYVLAVSGARIDSTIVDQNVGSGGWVTLLTASLPKLKSIDVTVSDVSVAPGSGFVLRADALKFMLRQEATLVEKGVRTSVPESFQLEQNHPNPFNPSTVVEYAIPHASYVTVRVYDVLGRRVAVLFEGMAAPGWYTVSFQAFNLPSGPYLCRLESGGFVQTRKMLLLK
ncbi:MAG: T9SS type A sorting domain-containing protein [Ignavibacteriales bacterium]|nr:T9SS type A sorting domain-containing protein [Ignavibacteriales bacterium]